MRTNFRLTKGMCSDDPVEAAEEYIKAGFKLIVTHGIKENGKCTCGNPDCTSPGKHPMTEYFPHGVKNATDDIELIEKAFEKYPDGNLAVALVGLTVVDTDGPKGEEAVREAGLPATITGKTNRGKHRHFFGEFPDGYFKGDQLDVLTGASRYAMLPPSIHESGRQYKWLSKPGTMIAKLPAGKINKLRTPAKPPRKAPKKSRIKKGERNSFLFRFACAIRRRVDDEDVVAELVGTVNRRLCEEPLSAKELRTLLRSSGNYGEAPGDLFGPPDITTPLPMEWLWYPYIPLFGLTLIAGNPGMGKSLLTALLIAIVSAGKRWPLSSDRPSGNKVLLLSAEDSWARVTLHRLEKAGADIGNIHVMHKVRALDNDRLELLAAYIEAFKPVLIVIDTLSTYMGGGRDMHRQNEVTEFLAQLTEIAEENGAAVVAIAHLNKQTNEHPMFRIVGSIGFAASIRSALFFGTDPTDRSRLALAHGKANASEKGKTIVFEKIGGGKNDVPILKAIEFSDADETDVCKVEKGSVGRPSNEHDAAVDFVLDFLAEKPTRWESVRVAAEARSIASAATLNVVRAELAKSGEILQVGKGPSARWKRATARSDPDDDE